MADVGSYRTTVDGEVVATAEDERVSFRIRGEVLVNVTSQRLNATARVEGLPGANPGGDPSETYLDGYTAYMECARVGWERRNLSRSEPWLDYTPLGQHLALLNRTEVYWRGTDTVDGRNASVVVAYPTKEDLEAVDLRSVGMAERLESATVENLTVTVWLDVGTDRPIRIRRDVVGSQDGATARANGTYRFTDFDAPTHLGAPEIDGTTWATGCPGA